MFLYVIDGDAELFSLLLELYLENNLINKGRAPEKEQIETLDLTFLDVRDVGAPSR